MGKSAPFFGRRATAIQERTAGGDDHTTGSSKQIVEICCSIERAVEDIQTIDRTTTANFVKDLEIVAASTLFVDPHSLLALAYSYQNQTPIERAVLANEAKEALGYTSLDHVIVAEGYGTDLPSLFRNKAGDNDSCILPAFPTVEAWQHAYWNSVQGNILDTKKRLLHRAEQYLTGDAYIVALKCINLSYAFLETLFVWMPHFYRAMVRREHSEADAWDLVSEMVRCIFHDLYRARCWAQARGSAAGRPKHEVEAVGDRLRATLKAHEKAKQFENAGFWKHPSLQVVFNSFLMETMVPKCKYQELEKRIKELESEGKGNNSKMIRNKGKRVSAAR